MAEKAAHFTSTFEVKPSIFEVIAQRSLNDTLHPAFEKIAKFLATCSPKNFGWIASNYDEMFLVLIGLLQYHYLKNHGASFSEYFYGLHRVSNVNSLLTNEDKKLSLVFLVLVPYFKRKLEDRIVNYRLEHAEGMLKKDWEGSFKKNLVLFYSMFEVGWGSWMLVNYLRYMADQTEVQVPTLWMINLKLAYAPQMLESEMFWTDLFRGRFSFKEATKGILQNSVRAFLEVGAFFTQFLHMWNAEQTNFNIKALPLVLPPPLDNRAQHFTGKCPLCLQSWKIPTILPVSGYVFCFPCLVKHLQEHQRCPVTNLPGNPLDVIRLFDSDL